MSLIRLLVVTCLFMGLACVAAPKPPRPLSDEEKARCQAAVEAVEGVLTSLKYQPQRVKVKESQFANRCPLVVNKERLLLDVYPTRDAKELWFVVRLRQYQDPNKLSRDNLLRMFIESEEYGTCFYSYNLEDRRFQLKMSLDRRDLTADNVKKRIERLTNMAIVTQDLWDDRRWHKSPP